MHTPLVRQQVWLTPLHFMCFRLTWGDSIRNAYMCEYLRSESCRHHKYTRPPSAFLPFPHSLYTYTMIITPALIKCHRKQFDTIQKGKFRWWLELIRILWSDDPFSTSAETINFGWLNSIYFGSVAWKMISMGWVGVCSGVLDCDILGHPKIIKKHDSHVYS